jgi:hypothetical protein
MLDQLPLEIAFNIWQAIDRLNNGQFVLAAKLCNYHLSHRRHLTVVAPSLAVANMLLQKPGELAALTLYTPSIWTIEVFVGDRRIHSLRVQHHVGMP